MAKWTFEPGHTAAAFCVRHMMVTFVRGTRDAELERGGSVVCSSVEIVIDAEAILED